MRRRGPLYRRTVADRIDITGRRLVAAAYARLKPLLRWKIPMERIRALTPDGSPGAPSVVVAGMRLTTKYFVRKFLGSDWHREALGSVPLMALPRALRRLRAGADLVIARVPRPGSAWLFDSSYLRVPVVVSSLVEVPPDNEALARMSTRARRNMAVVQRNGLRWSVSVSEQDFELFYDQFYLPFVMQRFTERALPAVRNDLRRSFRRGFILWIEDGEKRIAGAVLEPDGETLLWWVVGVLTDGVDPVKSGALSAIYVFGIECARQHGFRWFHAGLSRASLRDGVLSHKRSWGAVVRDAPFVDYLLFRWERLGDPIARFLSEDPLIFREGRGLSAVAALPPGAPSTLESARAASQKIAMGGLQRLYLLSTTPWPQSLPGAARQSGDGLWISDAAGSAAFRAAGRPVSGGLEGFAAT